MLFLFQIYKNLVDLQLENNKLIEEAAADKYELTNRVSIESFPYEWETESRYGIHSIQPITTRKIIAQPIRMLGHGMVTARHGHHTHGHHTARTVP